MVDSRGGIGFPIGGLVIYVYMDYGPWTIDYFISARRGIEILIQIPEVESNAGGARLCGALQLMEIGSLLWYLRRESSVVML